MTLKGRRHMPMIDGHGGAPLHVKDMGTGPPVILIHGWPLTGDMWEYQTFALIEAGYRVITYDRRGFGHSAHPAGGYDYDIFADDLAAVIDGLDLRDVALVGFSMGGGEIARYLSRHGAGKVAKAALISSVVPYLKGGRQSRRCRLRALRRDEAADPQGPLRLPRHLRQGILRGRPGGEAGQPGTDGLDLPVPR